MHAERPRGERRRRPDLRHRRILSSAHALRRGAAIAIAILAAGAGCAGGGGDGGPDANPTVTPTAVAAPTATATPGFIDTIVTLTVGSTVPLGGIELTAFYPVDKGSFAGSGDQVSCRITTDALFTANDQDDGTLVVSLASANELTLPADINCLFVAGRDTPVTAADIETMVTEVAKDGALGDPTTVSVTAAVIR